MISNHDAIANPCCDRVRARWRRLRLFKASVNVGACRVGDSRHCAGRCSICRPVARRARARCGHGARRRRCRDGVARCCRSGIRRPTSRSRASSRSARPRSTIGSSAPSTSFARDANDASPALVGPMLADAARRVAALDLDSIVPRELLRRAGFQARGGARASRRRAVRRARAGAPGVRRGVADAVSRARRRSRSRRATRASRPARRWRSRRGWSATARRSSRRSQIADGDRWRVRPRWTTRRPARSIWRSVRSTASFKYRVVAGAVTSPTYEIAGRACRRA